MSDPSPLLSVSEAAIYLSVPVRMIRRLVSDRRLPCTKIGRYVRFEREALDEFIAQNRRVAS